MDRNRISNEIASNITSRNIAKHYTIVEFQGPFSSTGFFSVNFSTGYIFFPVEKLSSGSTFLPLKNAFSDRLGQHRFIIYLMTGTVSGYPNVNTLFLTHNLRISKFSSPWYFKASLLCLYRFSDFKSLDQFRNLSFLTKYIWRERQE